MMKISYLKLLSRNLMGFNLSEVKLKLNFLKKLLTTILPSFFNRMEKLKLFCFLNGFFVFLRVFFNIL